MYISIRKYKTNNVAEVANRTEASFLDVISKIKGFKAFHVIETNEGIASISIFDTKEGIEESNTVGPAWAAKSLGNLVQGPPEILTGEVLVTTHQQ